MSCFGTKLVFKALWECTLGCQDFTYNCSMCLCVGMSTIRNPNLLSTLRVLHPNFLSTVRVLHPNLHSWCENPQDARDLVTVDNVATWAGSADSTDGE